MNAQPIIPWIGGKRRLADRLIPLFPPHSCYVEVFCGGAALFFLRPVPADVEVINDINGELVNLYRVVKCHLEEFVRQFKWALSSRQIFKWHQMTEPETLTDIQRAARFFLPAAARVRRQGARAEFRHRYHCTSRTQPVAP
ncbi:MAG: DNA adenine methylase [Gallionella sp.]|nr:DNA adenine methylase [Gallionella sp.]MDP1940870.1 DNA adenine methylase [Gallionella sp.]